MFTWKRKHECILSCVMPMSVERGGKTSLAFAVLCTMTNWFRVLSRRLLCIVDCKRILPVITVPPPPICRSSFGRAGSARQCDFVACSKNN